MEKIKVLFFVDRLLLGGIQKLLYEWTLRFDKTKFEIEFLTLDDGKKYELEQVLKNLNIKVYKLENCWINNPLDLIKVEKKVSNFFKEHNDYKVLHFNSTSKNYFILKYAKKYNIPIRIAHSHSISFQTQNNIKKICGNILKILLKKYSTDYFACSKIAGEWMFGKSELEKGKVKIIHNAIDYNKFKFDKNIRKKTRKKLGISDNDVLIGNVGRFVTSKNHLFLIDLFHEVCKINQNYKLLLIGTGPLEYQIKKEVYKFNLEEKVIFLGESNKVNEYMQAMDLFVFPSLYEGLGMVLIEAQASGLCCLASKNVIPEEAVISKNLKLLDLSDKNLWIYSILRNDKNRINVEKEIRKKEYIIDDVVEELSQFYMNNRGD